MSAGRKTLKFQMMMSPEEARILDDWMFANRVRSRAEAIRLLCAFAIQAGNSVTGIPATRAPQPLDYIAEAITEHFGGRCLDYVMGCPCCEAWEQYDKMRAE